VDGRGSARGFLSQVLIWDDHAWLVPRIRAALDAGVPPTAIILRDPGRKEYGAWDLKLAAAYHIYSDMLRGSVPVYWDESDRVTFDVKVGKSKSRAAIERREEADSKGKKDTKGLYYYAVPRTIDGGPLPTLDEWHEERLRKAGVQDKRQQASPMLGLDGRPIQR
jgi:hypothetical protein